MYFYGFLSVFNTTMFASDIKWGWLLIMTSLTSISLYLIWLVIKYIRVKEDGMKSLMDRAHLLFFGNLTIVSMSFSIRIVVQETLKFTDDALEVMAHGFDISLHTLRLSTVLLGMNSLIVQFIMAFSPENAITRNCSTKTVMVVTSPELRSTQSPS